MTSDLFGGEVVGWPGVSRQILSPRWSPDGRPPDLHQLPQRVSRHLCAGSGHANPGAPGQRAGHQHRRAVQPGWRPGRDGAERRGELRDLREQRPGADDLAAHPQSGGQGRAVLVARRHAAGVYLRAGAAAVRHAGGRRRDSRSESPPDISRYCAEPDWCRWDPSKIAFTMAEGRGYQVAVYDFSTGQAETVSHAPLDAIEPCWLADGRHLIYTAREANQRRLMILDTETRKRHARSAPRPWASARRRAIGSSKAAGGPVGNLSIPGRNRGRPGCYVCRRPRRSSRDRRLAAASLASKTSASSARLAACSCRTFSSTVPAQISL